MTSDATLRQADELIAELIELVETARNLPMSSSCVLPRERVLDLLDELRDVLPPELSESRKVIAARDQLIHNAFTEATETRRHATEEADTILTDARHNAEALVADAEQKAERTLRLADERAHEMIAAAEDEQVRLVAASAVHQAATEASARLRAEAEAYRDALCGDADEYNRAVRAEADQYGRHARGEAERYATKLAADAETYAEQTLQELAATLRRAAATADQGRAALAERRAGGWSEAPGSAEPVEDRWGADEESFDQAALTTAKSA